MSIENTCETPWELPITIDAWLERLNEVSTLTGIQVDMQERISQMESGFNYEIWGSDSWEYIIRVSRFTEGCNIAHSLIHLPPDINKVNEINTLVLRLFELRKTFGSWRLELNQSSPSESWIERNIVYRPDNQWFLSWTIAWLRWINSFDIPSWLQHPSYINDILNFLSQLNNPL